MSATTAPEGRLLTVRVTLPDTAEDSIAGEIAVTVETTDESYPKDPEDVTPFATTSTVASSDPEAAAGATHTI